MMTEELKQCFRFLLETATGADLDTLGGFFGVSRVPQSVVTWEAARNAPSQQMYDQKDWDEYMQAYGQACGSGGSCGNSNGGSCGSSCEPKRRIEDLPCTCNEEQYKNHAATGQGYSDTCPYHTEWAKERRRVERGL